MDDVENVGIMQGFLDKVREEEDDLEEEEDSEEGSSARMLDRKPDSPEILMNNLRGDMRSVDARREELADLVGYKAAAETPDSVLAMLQPVLAQGAGLGALPQSGPMAQGPQAPMPPPPGGEMGMPPQPAPPAPSGGDMAALLAAATPAPGGGMAPGGAMMGPNGQPIPPEGLPPIQMSKGGSVERFKDGSEEEAVAPSEPQLASSPFEDLLTNLGKPKAEISIDDAMQRRMAQYEKLGLAPSTQSAKANILFDIAGAALGYAANRGPGGEALSGDGLGRFAAAFSALPAAIQKRVSDIQDTRRQLSLYALEASEKEQQEIRDYNARLQSEQSDILTAAVREQGANERAALSAQARLAAAERGALAREYAANVGAGTGAGGGGPYGKGNQSLNIFMNLADLYGRGETTPEQDRAFETAVADYTQPRYVSEVDMYGRPTGRFTRAPGNILPEYVRQAVAMRGQTQAGVPAAPAEGAPEAAAVPPAVEPAPLMPPAAESAPLTPPAVSQEATAEETRPTISLWRDRKLIAGPVTTALAFASRTPGLGDPMSSLTVARQQARQITEDFVSAFTKSKSDAVSEQALIREITGIGPSLSDPEVYGSRLIALSTFLERALEENREKADSSPGALGSTLDSQSVSQARQKVQLLEGLKSSLGLPPAVYTEEEYRRYPVGTEVLWQGIKPARVVK